MTAFAPTASYLTRYWQDAFDLEVHLQKFLDLDAATLQDKLAHSQAELARLGRRDFDWSQADAFYRDQVGSLHILDLAAWHLSSRDYIGDTLRLVTDQLSGTVLDFGGGIGTHTLAAALSPQVEQVLYWDLNPLHQRLVAFRAEQLGLSHKVQCPAHFPDGIPFDGIICLDVLEHLPDPVAQLQQFHGWLSPAGKLVANWYFFKGFDQEFPFHLDDQQVIQTFFRVLQNQFLEVFHPYLITTRCYGKAGS